MNVEITPSKATHEDHPYGDGTAREHLREPAEAFRQAEIDPQGFPPPQDHPAEPPIRAWRWFGGGR